MRRQHGFTLIELMIVVAVIAILAAIAIPNYLEQTRKGRRADAVRAVGQLQLSQERWRAENPAYGTMVQLGAPEASSFYTFTVPSNTATAYTITATRAGAQATDRCGNLTATNLAKPVWSGDANCNN